MPSTYRYTDRQPTTLASGRPLAIGDRIPASQIGDDPDPHDKYLIETGRLVAIDAEPDELSADELDARARDLNIEGRSKMNADEKRAAIAKAEEEAAG